MKKTLEVINELKEKGLIQDYAIGGAIGVLRWVEPFFTRDLDIFIILTVETKDKKIVDFSSLYEYLKKKGYDKWVGQWLMIEGVPVEFIPAWDLSQEAVENAVKTEFDGIATKVIAPEYLIALLLVASRQKDAIKIRMLLKQAKIDIEKLKRITAKYGLSEKLKSYFEDGKNE